MLLIVIYILIIEYEALSTVVPGPLLIMLLFWSVIFSVKETISPYLSFLYQGVWGSKRVKSSEPGI